MKNPIILKIYRETRLNLRVYQMDHILYNCDFGLKI